MYRTHIECSGLGKQTRVSKEYPDISCEEGVVTISAYPAWAVSFPRDQFVSAERELIDGRAQ